MATLTTTVAPAEAKPEGQWAVVLRRFRHHRMAMISLVLISVVLLASLFAPLIAPFPRDYQDLTSILLKPMSVDATGQLRILGSDRIGQDYFTRVLYAARISLLTAIIVTLISSTVGIILGMLAGYFGGLVDNLITRTIEFISTFPSLTILLIMSSILVQSKDLFTVPVIFTAPIGVIMGVNTREAELIVLIIFVLALLGWTGTARMMRGMVLSVREQQYIESSRALGASHVRVMIRHVFPNALPPLIVDFTLNVNGNLVAESALSLLGFGIQPPTPTWGNMLANTASFMFQHPWMPLVPGIPLLICSIAINYIGDGLRDALDPKQRIG